MVTLKVEPAWAPVPAKMVVEVVVMNCDSVVVEESVVGSGNEIFVPQHGGCLDPLAEFCKYL